MEAVNHPSHYNSGNIEVIEAIEDWGFGPGFCRGNAIKYAARAGKKDPSRTIEDLSKAVWYLNREIEILSAAMGGRQPVRPNDMNPRSNKSDVLESVLGAIDKVTPAERSYRTCPHVLDPDCIHCLRYVLFEARSILRV